MGKEGSPLNRSESKYFATAARMDDAFLELIARKDFAYITVKEICEKAGVNRSTFYLHYETVDDLLEESTQRILEQFKRSMPQDTVEFMEKLPSRPLEELYLITPEYLIPYLNYVKENRRVFRVSMEKASVLKLEDAYGELFRHVLSPILARFGVPAEERRYIMSFYINGLIAIVNDWLREDCSLPVEQVMSIMQTCVQRMGGS